MSGNQALISGFVEQALRILFAINYCCLTIVDNDDDAIPWLSSNLFESV